MNTITQKEWLVVKVGKAVRTKTKCYINVSKKKKKGKRSLLFLYVK